MLRNKHLRLDQDKIERVKRILKANTETEALDRALDRLIQEDQERLSRKRIMNSILELRRSLGRKEEDSAEWIRAARKERMRTRERRT